MEFAKQFNEAAQKAVLTKIESGEWVNFPWMETLIKQSVRTALTTVVTINPLSKLLEETPRDICGCPAGFCTCHDKHVLTETPPCKVFSSQEQIAEAAKKHGINPDVLAQMAWAESAENKRPIGGVVEVPDSFESDSFAHEDGYDWRIMVSDRNKNHRNSWVENFNRPPTQEEFEHQFRHFHARTHYVHVNHWVDGSWTTITADYVPGWNKEKPEETFTATDEWPEGKKYRIRFHDQRIGRENYVYFDGKPGGVVLAKYHSAKCFAVVESRPEGI